MTGIYRNSRAMLYADTTCEICQAKAIRSRFCFEQVEGGETDMAVTVRTGSVLKTLLGGKQEVSAEGAYSQA